MRLNLILGIARSGTSWLHTVLSKTTDNVRSIKEPLFAYDSIFGNNRNFKIDDFKSFNNKPLSDDHPLKIVYNSCLYDRISKKHRKVIRNDENYYTSCLVKEIHSLLSIPSLIKSFPDIKILIIYRDPLYIIDSLLSMRKENLNYFKTPENELNYFIEIPDMLTKNKRSKIILKKYFAITDIYKEWIKISYLYPDNIKSVNYEDLCTEPKLFKNIAEDVFNIKFNSKENEFLKKTMSKHVNGNYSIYRQTKSQINRNFRFLTDEEIKMCKDIN